MSKPQGTTGTGFLAKEVGGSETTYFCDFTYLYASCVAKSGGDRGNGSRAGSFRLDVNDVSLGSDPCVSARLMYLYEAHGKNYRMYSVYSNKVTAATL